MNRPTDPRPAAHDKILTRDDLIRLRAEARATGRIVVHCHGCFDIVHPGHIRHLRFAAQQGDILLVTITADDRVDKGAGRPLFPQDLRAENLAVLDFVNWVFVNPDATAVELLDAVQPDVFIKGSEYADNKDPRFAAERAAVEQHGGRVVFSSGDIVFSSTALIQALSGELSDTDHPHDPRARQLQRLRRGHDVDADALTDVMRRFQGQRALVVGELINDSYVFCDQPEVASEAACMSLRPLDRAAFDGGAAVIARHLAALGARPTLLTPLPNTIEAATCRNRLETEGVEVVPLTIDHPMFEKQRFLVGSDKVMKLDLVQPLALDETQRAHLEALAAEIAGDAVDLAIIADFRLGLFTDSSLAALARALRGPARILSADVSGRRNALRSMPQLDLATPSETELREAMRDFDASLNAVVFRYLRETAVKNAIVTLGRDGAIAFSPKPDVDASEWASHLDAEHIPALTAYAVDPLGCGDALLATASLAAAAGADLVQAAYLGAVAAAIAGARLGNHAVDAATLRRKLLQLEQAPLSIDIAAPTRSGLTLADPPRTATS